MGLDARAITDHQRRAAVSTLRGDGECRWRTDLVTAAGLVQLPFGCNAVIAVGLDNLNDYYDPNLKQARLRQIEAVASAEPGT